MGLAYDALGPTGLVLLRLLVIAALLIVVWLVLRGDGVPPVPRLSLVMFAALLMYPRTQHLRPQLFSTGRPGGSWLAVWFRRLFPGPVSRGLDRRPRRTARPGIHPLGAESRSVT
jgi:hypothetical protein